MIILFSTATWFIPSAHQLPSYPLPSGSSRGCRRRHRAQTGPAARCCGVYCCGPLPGVLCIVYCRDGDGRLYTPVARPISSSVRPAEQHGADRGRRRIPGVPSAAVWLTGCTETPASATDAHTPHSGKQAAGPSGGIVGQLTTRFPQAQVT